MDASSFRRRQFLQRTAVLAATPFTMASLFAGSREGENTFPGLITRQSSPPNLEMPFSSLRTFVTPTEQFFVRCHFPIPKLEARTWRLKIEGAVKQEIELTLDDLRKMPERTVTATLECAGNGRVYLTPREQGVLWEQGAIGNAEWTGVPLAAVLERAGLKPDAVEVVLEGADRGEVGEPKSPGVISYSRSIPLSKARRPEVLLAYRMNGEELTPSHGFPVRAVVAGWYGMASVKWLTRLLVVTQPFTGFYQTLDYSRWDKVGEVPTLVPLNEMPIKSAIARPTAQEIVRRGADYRIFGAAWAGESEVAKVEVSTDGGKSWQEAKLLDKPVPFAWRLWELDWHVPATPGQATLLVRAIDRRGRTQPLQRDRERRNYMINHLQPIDVVIR